MSCLVAYHRTTQTQPILILMIVLYTFSEEAQLNDFTGKQDCYTAPFSKMERTAYQVWMF